jgi:ATP-binding protein involved in chromosome partitioning
MFSKIFQSKDKSEKVSADPQHKPQNELQQVVKDFFAAQQSELFPQGILTVCQLLNVDKKDNHVSIELEVPFPCQSYLDELAQQLTERLNCPVGISVKLNVIPVKKHEIPGITNIIAVASGKGGVGKSTTAVNLAYALIDEGATVGILDADIYGPSIPAMLGLQREKPTSTDGKLLTPLDAHGLSAMSLGFLVEQDDATVWRGPMASRAFDQLLNETAWQQLDYLIVDMPPGTGDIQLTLAQKVPVAAAVIVTTPQDIALADAVKGIAMFNKVNVPVLGIVENMSYHLCENCGHHSALFGEGGGARIAEKFTVNLLGQLPLDIAIREDADQGNSPLLSNSSGEVAKQYRKIAKRVAAKLFNEYDARSPQTSAILFKEI